jgi:hypothetical protein
MRLNNRYGFDAIFQCKLFNSIHNAIYNTTLAESAMSLRAFEERTFVKQNSPVRLKYNMRYVPKYLVKITSSRV